MEIVLAARNPSKVLQVKTLFGDSTIVIKTLDDFGIVGEALEDGTTLEENASKKVDFAAERSRGRWIMADDTGLFIRTLAGEPGVNAAYWGGPELSTEERMRYCLHRLVGASDRSAIFRTVVVVRSPDGRRRVFSAQVPGHLLGKPRVAPQPKMPYSALFVPDGEERAWAEMTTEYENKISHRGKAFRQVEAFLSRT